MCLIGYWDKCDGSMSMKTKQDELKDVLSEIAELYVKDREAGIKELKKLLDDTLKNDLEKIASDVNLSQIEKDVLRFLYIRCYFSLHNDLNTEQGFWNVWKVCKTGFKIISELKK